MIAILGLLALIAAAALAVVGVATNSGSAHPLGDSFTIAGLHLSGLSTGQLFLYGIVVGAVGMLGLSMLLGGFSRRAASRGSRRELKGSRRETTAARLERDRLTRQLDDEHTERPRPDTPSGVGTPRTLPSTTSSPAGEDITTPDQPRAGEPAIGEPVPAGHRRILHRFGQHPGP
jgi:hypothetical protein